MPTHSWYFSQNKHNFASFYRVTLKGHCITSPKRDPSAEVFKGPNKSMWVLQKIEGDTMLGFRGSKHKPTNEKL